jgi:hypothetical protein
MITVAVNRINIKGTLNDAGIHNDVKQTYKNWLPGDPVDNLHNAQVLLALCYSRLKDIEDAWAQKRKQHNESL